jgi:HK97 family phage major capsid protein
MTKKMTLEALAKVLKDNGVEIEETPDDTTPAPVAPAPAEVAQDKMKSISFVNKMTGDPVEDAKRHLADSYGIQQNQTTTIKGVQVNTPAHSTRSGYGDEMVPPNTLAGDIFELMPTYGSFIGKLPGRHTGVIGQNKGEGHEVTIIGDVGLFDAGTEKTSGSFAVIEGGAVPTAKVTLTSKQLVKRLDITDHLGRFGRMSIVEWETWLKQKLAQALVRTEEYLIINGDTATGATTNINDIAGTPAGTEVFLLADGLRKTAIGTTTPNGDPDLATIDAGDVATMLNTLGTYFTPEECLFITNIQTNNKITALDSFTDASKRGGVNTVEGKTLLSTLGGAEVVVHRDFALTNAAGKIDLDTTANNTKGGLLLFRKDCVQFGDSGDLSFRIYDFGAQGVQLEVWTYFAATVVNQKAGATDFPSVALGINATV